MNPSDDKKKPDRYGDELLSANWNPVIDLLERSCTRTRELAEGAVREEDAEAFLGRVYTHGS